MSKYVITFWRYADENQMPITILDIQADSASHALYQAVDTFVQHGWERDIDHVSVKKLNGKPAGD